MLTLVRLAAVSAFVIALATPASAHNPDSDAGRFEYALVEPGTGHGRSISATSNSWEHLERLRDRETEPFFWFVLSGRAWIARDAATVAEATRILAPVRELGKKQGKLGAKQGEYGARQGRLGAEQGKLGARQGVLGARLGQLASRSASRRGESAATRAERHRIEDEMAELGRQQRELGRRQGPFGKEQARLGAQQSELGKQQASASKRARGELERLGERAVHEGRATRAD